ncbi:hypothetical protein DEALK_06860 [Dehalogenimonas alkenigignens]|uniref:Uncharacterized protein n=1 Tax=Dehalogenimonas alkenigignens TaxID=1217799 RepID=A0A0W0GH17_9CHLR|nr:hypothetical protein [Dehalogenimonas alkenigignens]KTB47841.1 hypothetical protein DEALK_06860 [Dehalogenimonas alkenigignens]
MSLFVRAKSGVSRLSEIEIDTDKDWGGKLIRNLGGIGTSMQPGDIIYRGNAVFERLPLEYGNGYNVLKALNHGSGRPGWLDIQELIIYMTGAVNRVASLPLLVMPRPSMALLTAEDHSGGSFTAGKALSIAAPGIAVSHEANVDLAQSRAMALVVPAPSIGVTAQLV